MSESVSKCDLCGWQDTGRPWKPGQCPRCLQIKEMFLAGKRSIEIGALVGMPGREVRSIARRLGLKW